MKFPFSLRSWPPIKSTKVEPEAKTPFCDRCYKLVEYIENVTKQGYLNDAPDISVKESRAELMRSKCRLCHFFAELGIHHKVNRDEIVWSRNIVSILEEHDPAVRFRNDRCFFVARRSSKAFGLHHRSSTRDSLAPRRIVPNSIDYDILKGWVEFCHEHHSGMCGRSETRPVPGFKLIDCRTREVVNAEPEAEYVALSYVWGSDKSVRRSKDSWPLTIRDSMTLALQLGFQYLWVDRYCINQNNALEKHTQIQNMDYIYSRAELTIIAAAGKDPHYGLPGVSSRHRIPQKHITIGDGQLVQMYLYETDLQHSPWASRAWTLQEGFLSRRRVIFTDHEVAFLCNRMHCRESVKNELISPAQDAEHGLVLSNYLWKMGWRPTRSTKPETIATNLMNESSVRDLSFDEDALNVVVGILKHLGVRHWWGMLVSPTDLDLAWRKPTPGRRREGFPSWSWVSVTGTPARRDLRDPGKNCCTFEMPLSDSQWQTIAEWTDSTSLDDTLNGRRSLRITGPILTPVFMNKHDLQRSQFSLGRYPQEFQIGQCNAIFEIQENEPEAHIFARVLLDDVADNLETLSDAVALVWYTGSFSENPILIIMRPTDGGYKRVGWCEGWNVVDVRLGCDSFRYKGPPIPVPPPTTFELF